jgi:hypothetical protein
MFCIRGLVITNGDVCSLYGYLICRVCMLLIRVTVEIQTVIPSILLPLIFFVLLPPHWLNQYDLTGGLQVTFRPKPLVIMPMKLLLVTTSSFIYFYLDLKSVCEPHLVCCFMYKCHTWYWLQNHTEVYAFQVNFAPDTSHCRSNFKIICNLCTFQ